MRTAQGGAAAETPRRPGGDSRMRIVQGPGQARVAKALLSARGARHEARGPAQRLGAPRPTLVFRDTGLLISRHALHQHLVDGPARGAGRLARLRLAAS